VEINDFIQVNDATLVKEVTRDDTALQILNEWNGKSGNDAKPPENEENDRMAIIKIALLLQKHLEWRYILGTS